jgi:single-strand DNA-binding protein
VSFGRQAEVIAQYAKKGASLYVEGRLQTRSWDDKTSGEKKYRTEILVEQLQLGPRASGAGMSQSAPTSTGPAQKLKSKMMILVAVLSIQTKVLILTIFRFNQIL